MEETCFAHLPQPRGNTHYCHLQPVGENRTHLEARMLRISCHCTTGRMKARIRWTASLSLPQSPQAVNLNIMWIKECQVQPPSRTSPISTVLRGSTLSKIWTSLFGTPCTYNAEGRRKATRAKKCLCPWSQTSCSYSCLPFGTKHTAALFLIQHLVPAPQATRQSRVHIFFHMAKS